MANLMCVCVCVCVYVLSQCDLQLTRSALLHMNFMQECTLRHI